MENKDISQITLNKIKEQGIKPISRSIFNVKRICFWVIVGLSFVLGSFFIAFILSAIFKNDWDLYNRFGFNFIFKTIPYFWLASLVIFSVLGEFYYRKTLLGHRHRFIFIALIYLVSTTIFGFILYVVGIGDLMEDTIDNVPTRYQDIIVGHNGIWSHPENGLLSGQIILINDGEFQMVDKNGVVWVIDRTKALTRGNVSFDIGQKIKIIGDKINQNLFQAEEIRPWIGIIKKQN